MRIVLTLLLIVALVGCKDPTNNKHDPILLIRNADPGQTVTFTWRDGQGIVGNPVYITQIGNFCEHFDAQPDSAYYEFVRADSTGGWASYQSNWFDPTARPTWTVDLTNSAGHNILVKDTTDVPC